MVDGVRMVLRRLLDVEIGLREKPISEEQRLKSKLSQDGKVRLSSLHVT
jgi:hypothetical protein